MAFRLGELVVRGELFNTRRNSTHGWLQFRGLGRPLMFELTGNCSADLFGRHIRFQVRDLPEEDEPEDDESGVVERARVEELGLTGIAWQQVGPTGDMTVKKVRVADCPPEELYIRCKLGEPPPTEWKPCLYLEWYSQNGRVVVEMVDPEIEYLENEDKGEKGEGAEAQPELELPAGDEPTEEEAGGLSVTSITREGDEYVVRDETPASEEDEAEDDDDEDGEGEPESYGVVPKELERELERETRERDRAWRGEEDETIREMELMDDLIESGPGEPLGLLFDEPLRLPPADRLDDAAVEAQLKVVLAQLAMYGVAVHMCEHFSPRDTYRLITEDLAKEQGAYRELRGTGWVQNFDTAESCPQCQAAFDREYEDMNRRMQAESGEAGEEDKGGDEDIPL